VKQTRRPWLALAVLCLGTFAVLMDTTVVNVALPSLNTGRHASLDQAPLGGQWLPAGVRRTADPGWLDDRFGPRRLAFRRPRI
jgi:hypothetical protein